MCRLRGLRVDKRHFRHVSEEGSVTVAHEPGSVVIATVLHSHTFDSGHGSRALHDVFHHDLHVWYLWRLPRRTPRVCSSSFRA